MNEPTLQLCLVLHNHQPVGNFDGVFEQAYQDSYLPFLEVFEPFADLKISLHTSGPLMQWLQSAHPDYLNRVAALVDAGRIEIVGGAFYEAILPMIPRRDRVGQIEQFTNWLTQRVCPQITGMWMPERVWESSLTSSIADAGIDYTVLDDYHFRRAGVSPDELHGYYIVEDEGRILRVYPGSEKLRYLIPFAPVESIIEHCRELANAHPGSVVVFGDDGEKFGTWPDTKEHVYERGWLREFFQHLTDNRHWLQTSTLAAATATTPPVGKIYLPDASYREMTEWALPVDRQIQYDEVVHEMEDQEWWPKVKPFLAGGFWRNFKVKYPETNQMYARMMYVSHLLQQSIDAGVGSNIIDAARDHLYRGQCNCAYWHGAFGGIYLPHLRNAIFRHLLTAERLLEQSSERPENWVEATSDDYNFDGRQEIRLANEQLSLWFSPQGGGHLYELDLMKIGHNLGSTIQRRNELYHAKVLQGENVGDDQAASIHDRVVFKQEGLDERLQYDDRLRASLIDHFYDEDVNVDALMQSKAMERGDFADGDYVAKIRRSAERVQVMMTREGNAWGVPLKITKGATLSPGRNQLELAWLIEGLPQDGTMHFATEFNFAGLPDGQDDRYYSAFDGTKLGDLGEKLQVDDAMGISLADHWLGVDLSLSLDQPAKIFAYPVQSVSQSESGFESVHQACCVVTGWIVRGDSDGRWSTRMRLSLQTDAAKTIEAFDQSVAVPLA